MEKLVHVHTMCMGMYEANYHCLQSQRYVIHVESVKYILVKGYHHYYKYTIGRCMHSQLVRGCGANFWNVV